MPETSGPRLLVCCDLAESVQERSWHTQSATARATGSLADGEASPSTSRVNRRSAWSCTRPPAPHQVHRSSTVTSEQNRIALSGQICWASTRSPRASTRAKVVRSGVVTGGQAGVVEVASDMGLVVAGWESTPTSSRRQGSSTLSPRRHPPTLDWEEPPKPGIRHGTRRDRADGEPNTADVRPWARSVMSRTSASADVRLWACPRDWAQ